MREEPCTITVSGELGIAGLQSLKQEVPRRLDGGCEHLVVDLTAATHVDPAALALFELARERRARGDIVLVAPDRKLRQHLARLGFSATGRREGAALAARG
jgi:anti-anti-sigma regulatory factor